VLCSMTGFGAATRETETATVSAEVRAVNGRFFKVSIKAGPALGSGEAQIEALCKSSLRRGSVSVSVTFRSSEPSALVTVDEAVARAYQAAFRRIGLAEDRIPMLPGVVSAGQTRLRDEELALVLEAVAAALEQLVVMREREGRALGGAINALLDSVERLRARIIARAPAVVMDAQARLRERVDRLLSGTDVAVEPDHLAREIALFADRSDVTEELDRLAAHLAQARELVAGGGEVGRSLDFLAQEMHREVNTIGSKSADIELSRDVVALKSELEKIREQVANIE